MLTKLLPFVAFASLVAARNNALDVNTNCQNDKCVDEHITTHGSDFLYAICAVMGLTALGCIVGGYMQTKERRSNRIFWWITAAINFTACIAYFTMGSNLGWTPIDVEFPRSRAVVSGVNREIFYVRYIDWFITTPLLLLDILLTARMPWSQILWTIFLDWVMIICGLVGALVKSRYKWGFWGFGTLAMFMIFYNIIVEGMKYATRLDAHHVDLVNGDRNGSRNIKKTYQMCGVWTLFIWMLYPIAWGLCEGGNAISSDSEAVFYGILDFCAKPIFSLMLLWGHRQIRTEHLGLHVRDYDDLPVNLSLAKTVPYSATAHTTQYGEDETRVNSQDAPIAHVPNTNTY